MLKIAICDDEPKDLETLRAQLLEAAQELGLECCCDLFSSAAELLAGVEGGQKIYDIALLDIYMEPVSGLEAAKRLLCSSPLTGLVFVTASRLHAVDAFDLDALHYLVKPTDSVQLKNMLERYLKKSRRKKSLEIRIGRDLVRLELDSILYLESARNGTDIHTAGGMLHTSIPTGTLARNLGNDFLKIQRGFIVNMHFIDRITSDSCVLKNDLTILLSRKDKKAIQTAYREFIFNVTGGKEP